ncbi:hypothetical protein HZH68_017137 [Vespula germanica]|uniref:Uncharacterized protein n=1 Tax=Vespula germanica TaxID=30212 RepID=A0A834MMT5_VESGE|nr:hypothetical protein HZH68_017137 [Vespula germanica]
MEQSNGIDRKFLGDSETLTSCACCTFHCTRLNIVVVVDDDDDDDDVDDDDYDYDDDYDDYDDYDEDDEDDEDDQSLLPPRRASISGFAQAARSKPDRDNNANCHPWPAYRVPDLQFALFRT